MKKILIFTAMMVMAGAQSALAHGDEHHHMDSAMQNPCSMHMNGDMGNMKSGFLTTKVIDGYTVTIHIMKAAEGMDKNGSHNVMIKFEKNGKVLTDLISNSKVVHPNGKSESKMLMKMGDWYMASYNLDHTGQHQLLVLFKTSDGRKHFGGVTYPKDKSEHISAE